MLEGTIYRLTNQPKTTATTTTARTKATTTKPNKKRKQTGNKDKWRAKNVSYIWYVETFKTTSGQEANKQTNTQTDTTKQQQKQQRQKPMSKCVNNGNAPLFCCKERLWTKNYALFFPLAWKRGLLLICWLMDWFCLYVIFSTFIYLLISSFVLLFYLFVNLKTLLFIDHFFLSLSVYSCFCFVY